MMKKIAAHPWVRHMILLTIALLAYYAVTFVVVYTTIMSPSVADTLVANGESPSSVIRTTLVAFFPIPAVLWIIGVVLSKWIAF